MKKLINTLALILGLATAISPAKSTDDEAFVSDLHRFKAFAANKISIDLTLFKQSWEPTLHSMHTQSPDQVDTEDRLNAETKLEIFMEELVNLLIYNYSQPGLELLRTYGTPRTLLRLARSYFDQTTTFIAANRPPEGVNLRQLSAQIYKQVWEHSEKLQKECMKEVVGLLSSGTISDLKFEFLPSVRRRSILETIHSSIASVYHLDRKCGEVGNFKLANISQEVRISLGGHLMYCLDRFDSEDMQRFAWCANYLLSDGGLALDLYTYEKAKKTIINSGEFPSFQTWIKAVEPARH